MSTWPWPRPDDDGAARHLVRGLTIPPIALESTSGRTVTLAELPGRVVVFIYPWTGEPGGSNPPNWDDIPGAHGSTPELTAVANLHSGFESLRVPAFGMSGQASDWQRAFVARNSLPFELLSDESGAFRDALRLPTFDTGGVRYLKRLTLVLKNGLLDRAFYPVHPPDVHPREVLAWTSATATYKAEARLKPAG